MYTFIVNPVAGNGKAKKIYKKIMARNLFLQDEVITYFTEYKGHATEIARRLEQQMKERSEEANIKLLVVIGGDGTIHEVVNGLESNFLPIAFLSGGTGNDFSRGLKLEKNFAKYIDFVRNNKEEIQFWPGEFCANDKQKGKFINCIGFGFDAVVAHRAATMPFKKILNKLRLGQFIYLIALFYELFKYKPISLTVKMDGIIRSFPRTLFVVVNNHPYFGGGMKINPTAVNNRDKLSLLLVHDISKWKILTLFGTVFLGKHIHFKEVHLFSAQSINISSDTLLPCQIDGEFYEMKEASITVAKTPVHIERANRK